MLLLPVMTFDWHSLDELPLCYSLRLLLEGVRLLDALRWVRVVGFLEN